MKVTFRIEIPAEVFHDNSTSDVANYIRDEVESNLDEAVRNASTCLDDIEITCDIED